MLIGHAGATRCRWIVRSGGFGRLRKDAPGGAHCGSPALVEHLLQKLCHQRLERTAAREDPLTPSDEIVPFGHRLGQGYASGPLPLPQGGIRHGPSRQRFRERFQRHVYPLGRGRAAAAPRQRWQEKPRGKSRGRHPHNKLTVLTMRQLGPGRHADGEGLYLFVRESGARQWMQRIVIQGRRRDLGLGAFPRVTLAEARRVAVDNRRVARAGGDPTLEAARKRGPTFRASTRSSPRSAARTGRRPPMPAGAVASTSTSCQ